MSKKKKKFTIDQGEESGFQGVESPIPTLNNLPNLSETGEAAFLLGIGEDGQVLKLTPLQSDEKIRLTGDVLGVEVEGSNARTELGEEEADIQTTLATPIDSHGDRLINVGEPVDTTDAATKNYVDTHGGGGGGGTITLQGDVTGSGQTGTPFNVSLTKPIDAGNQKVTQVATPTDGTDAANKDYVDANAGGGTITLQGDVGGSGQVGGTINTYLVSPIDANNQRIKNVVMTSDGLDAANKSYVDTKTNPQTITLSGAITGSGLNNADISTQLSLPIDAGDQKITRVADPTTQTDAANKAYVDANAGGGTITLQGAVSGSGTAGAPITTTLSTPLEVDTLTTSTVKSKSTNKNALTVDFQDSTTGDGNIEYKAPQDATGANSFNTTTSFNSTSSGTSRKYFLENHTTWNSSDNPGRYKLQFHNGSQLLTLFTVTAHTGTSKVTQLVGDIYTDNDAHYIGIAAPVSSTHLTNKQYVDGVTQSVEDKITAFEDRLGVLETFRTAVEVPLAYAFGWLGQKYTSNFPINDAVVWENVVTSSSSIQTTPNSPQVTLEAGRTYRLQATLGLEGIGYDAVGRGFQWWNVTENKYVGMPGFVSTGIREDNTWMTLSGKSTATAFLAPTQDTTLEVRCMAFEPEGTVSFISPGTSFSVESLQKVTA